MRFKVELLIIFLIVLLLLIILVPPLLTHAEARLGYLNDDIGVTLSKQCLTFLKNNFTTYCPGYDQILLLFPDQSNQKISGKFAIHDGILQRIPTHYTNHYKFYQFENITKRIWIDPPPDIQVHIKMITIENKLPEFKNTGWNKVYNNTRVLEKTRFVSSGCWTSAIAAEQWELLLGDTIQYMLHDCNKNYTHFDFVQKLYKEPTKHDITTSWKWKYEQWIKQIKVECANTFLKCTIQAVK